MQNIVFITGASSGIGKATAIEFAKAKFNIIITGRRSEKLLSLQKIIEAKYGVKCISLCFDIQNKTEVDEAIKSLPKQWQKIRILINNAGLALGRDAFDVANISDWEIMINTNIKGLLYVSKAIIPLMINTPKSHIINIGSIAGKEVYENGNIYCATKAAVDAISKALRIDLLKYQIKVTAIHPGAVETEFSIVRFKGDTQTAKKIYDGYKPLLAKDIANLIIFCATLPSHVNINDVSISCLNQANSYYLLKQ